MLNKINNFLIKNFGIKLIKVTKPIKSSKNKKKGNNLIIEFIGPPGVGKTTLCNYYLMHNKLPVKNKIITRKHIARLACGFPLKLGGVHERILNMKLQHDAKMTSINASKKLKSIQNFNIFVEHDYIIENYMNDKIIFLDEERLLSYFLDRPEAFSKEELTNYFNNRVFVFCDTDSENILEQIQTRAKKGKLIARHKNLSDDELLKEIDRRRDIIQKRYTQLKRNNVRTIKLEIRKGLEENTKILDKYLAEIRKI